jgi:gamma-glutamyl hydrolase
MKSLIILTLVVLAYSTERPIIGILTNPSDTKEYPSTDYSYFPASYVKWIESAGGLVVPIQWDSTYDEIDEILSKVNGVLFTGGDVDLYLNNTSPGYTFNKFTDTAAFILNKVILYNKAGHYYPLFGTC